MPATTIRAKGQVTIPLEIREQTDLEEGDPLLIEIVADGILLRPQKIVDATQAWFWKESWLKGERKATADIEAGRVTSYDDEDSFLKSLE